MRDFKQNLTVEERPLVSISVLDVTKHIVFGPVTQWIHDNLVEKKKIKFLINED